MTDAPINIFGPGAIGVLTAYFLEQSKYSFALLDRSENCVVRRLKAQGKVHILGGGTQINLSEAPASFVCVRALDLDLALKQLLPKLKVDSVVMVIVNGWVKSILADYQRLFPQLTIRWGSTTYGVSKLESDFFELCSEQGSYFWGALDASDSTSRCSAIERCITSKSNPFEFRENSEALLQDKWLMNTVINTLCGAKQLRSNGQLQSMASEVAETFEEACELGAKAIPNWQISPIDAKAKIANLIKLTAKNENSMARDIRLGRKTEAEFFSGLALGYDGFPQLKKLHEKIIKSTIVR